MGVGWAEIAQGRLCDQRQRGGRFRWSSRVPKRPTRDCRWGLSRWAGPFLTGWLRLFNRAECSVATVVATRMEFLERNGHPWNTWKAEIEIELHDFVPDTPKLCGRHGVMLARR